MAQPGYPVVWEGIGMLDSYRQLVVNQYEAVLAGLNFCIDRCPDALWDAAVGRQPFCQIVFLSLIHI